VNFGENFICAKCLICETGTIVRIVLVWQCWCSNYYFFFVHGRCRAIKFIVYM